jgi:hypothetical protein
MKTAFKEGASGLAPEKKSLAEAFWTVLSLRKRERLIESQVLQNAKSKTS